MASHFVIHGQIQVTQSDQNPYTPINLIEEVFLSDGIVLNNINFQGVPSGVGYFNTGLNTIGLETGIVLSSGLVNNIARINNQAGVSTTTSGTTVVDADLELIAGSPVQDVASYTIEFRPLSDTLKFRYVFASDEYPEFSCGAFNDPFGLFLSGPGIAGPYSNAAENLAVLSDGTEISITTVNNGNPTDGSCNGVNSEFYVDNPQGSWMEFDGFLTVMEVVRVVIPCQLYTLKIAIGDAGTLSNGLGDNAYDSAVFLEGGSFLTNFAKGERKTINQNGIVQEGCSSASVDVTLPYLATSDVHMTFRVGGTSSLGSDYFLSDSDSITIPNGQTNASLVIDVPDDGIAEGTESLWIAMDISACQVDTFFFQLEDNSLVDPDVGDDVGICKDDSVQLYPSFVPITSDELTFTNDSVIFIPDGSGANPGPTVISAITAAGVVPTALGPGVIQSVCFDILHNWNEDLNIFLRAPNGSYIELSTGNGEGSDHYNVCFVDDTNFPLIAQPGTPRPANGDGSGISGTFRPEGKWEDLWKDESPTNGIWELLVFDGQFAPSFPQFIQNFEITFNATYEVNYSYSPTEGLSCSDCANPMASPAATTKYVLTVSDNNGCEKMDSLTISVIDTIRPPVAICASNTPDDITVTWDPSLGATDYRISINGGALLPPNGNNSHFVSGLDPDQIIDITIRPLGDCITKDTSFQCQVVQCEKPMIILDSLHMPTCNGFDNGALFFSATSSIASSFNFLLQETGQITSSGNFGGLLAGNYSVVVQDNFGCFDTLMVTLDEPEALSSTVNIINEPLCPGRMDARGSVTAEGGTTPYSYLWDNGETSSTITGVGQGLYRVTITDDNGCTKLDSITFTDPPTYDLSLSSTDVSCNGAMDGSATVIATNGNAPYNYLWDNNTGSQMTATADNLNGDSYTVFVTDNIGCIQSGSVVVTEKSAIMVSISGTDATCDGIDDATAMVDMVDGGAGGYTYLWNDAAMTTNQSVSNVAVGYATVTITDADGCTKADSVLIGSPPAMTSSVTTVPVSCSGSSDGGATITISGGAGGYTYEWSDNGAMAATRDNLMSGDNIVTVTDNNGCRLIETINVPSQNEILVSFDSTVITCFGGNDGTAQINASGGVPPFNYLWNDPTNATGTNITNLTAGYYVVTVTDNNGCFVIDSVEVIQNERIQLESAATPIDCNGDGDGTATVNVLNGIVVDSYLWNDPGAQTTPTATNLDGGTYTVYTSYNGICTDSITAVVMEPGVLTIVIDKMDIACFGESNGSATANVTGGTGPFSYQWNDVSSQITQTASNLTAQGYMVTVTDANNCMATSSTTIIEPAELQIANLESTPVQCFNTPTGMGTVTPQGGTGSYTYVWSDGLSSDSIRNDLLPQRYYITITDASGCAINDSLNINNRPEMFLEADSTVVTCFGGNDGSAIAIPTGGTSGYSYLWDDDLAQTSRIANNLEAGTYSVTVTDALGCTMGTSIAVTQNPRINITGEIMDVACYNESNGSAEVSVSGGVGTYAYQWDDAASTTTPAVVGIPVGSYQVTVTDDLGCFDTLRLDIGQPDSLAISFTIDGLLCFGDDIGSITANVTGGNAGFMYLWDDVNAQTTATATGLMEGLYSITVSDNLNCTTIDTMRLIEPPALTLMLDSTDVLCNGANTGSINSTVGGGTPVYNYAYSDGSSIADPSGLPAGMYELTVTDNNGCTITESTIINEPSAVIIETMKTDIDCFGNINGTIDVTTSGGIMPYTFDWNTGDNTEDIQDLGAGTYVITVTDGNNCENTENVEITSPSQIQQSFTKTDIACFGEATGIANVTVTGGTPSYNYTWSNGESSSGISTVAAGRYYVTIEDANNCIAADSIDIEQPEEALTADVMTMDLRCFGDANGTIDIDANGGTAPYSYQLNNDPITSNPIFQGLNGGTYAVMVIDNSGCIITESPISLFEPSEIVVDLGDNKIIELGIDTVQMTPLISGGQGGLSYEYTGDDLTNLSCSDCPDPFIRDQVYTKEYKLTVSDEQGCMGMDNIRVIISKDRRVWVPTGFTPDADNANDLLVPLGDPNTLVLSFQIFDRWGTLVFEQSQFQLGDPNAGWDGTYKGQKLDPSVFVWKAEVKYFEDGLEETFAGETYLLK